MINLEYLFVLLSSYFYLMVVGGLFEMLYIM